MPLSSLLNVWTVIGIIPLSFCEEKLKCSLWGCIMVITVSRTSLSFVDISRILSLPVFLSTRTNLSPAGKSNRLSLYVLVIQCIM